MSNWIDEGSESLDEGSKDGLSISVKLGLDEAFEDDFEDGYQWVNMWIAVLMLCGLLS